MIDFFKFIRDPSASLRMTPHHFGAGSLDHEISIHYDECVSEINFQFLIFSASAESRLKAVTLKSKFLIF